MVYRRRWNHRIGFDAARFRNSLTSKLKHNKWLKQHLQDFYINIERKGIKEYAKSNKKSGKEKVGQI